jgi:tetratricopeptide (TPR) repeat protein
VTEMGSTKRALASLLYEDLPASSNADAVNCLQKAIAINPNRAMHHIELGRIYAQMEKSAEARKSIEKGLAMPNHDKDDAELKAIGRAVLAGLWRLRRLIWHAARRAPSTERGRRSCDGLCAASKSKTKR